MSVAKDMLIGISKFRELKAAYYNITHKHLRIYVYANKLGEANVSSYIEAIIMIKPNKKRNQYEDKQ